MSDISVASKIWMAIGSFGGWVYLLVLVTKHWPMWARWCFTAAVLALTIWQVAS